MIKSKKKRSPIKRESDGQKIKNKEVARLKKMFPPLCVICNERPFRDAAHILPKGAFPEHYTNPLNLVGLCGKCHPQFDEVLEFRQKQTKLIEQARLFDPCGTNLHFRL